MCRAGEAQLFRAQLFRSSELKRYTAGHAPLGYARGSRSKNLGALRDLAFSEALLVSKCGPIERDWFGMAVPAIIKL